MARDDVTLREYIDRRLEDLARYHDTTVKAIQDEIDRRLAVMTHDIEAQFAALAKQTTAAAATLDARLERMNEFRDAMRDQAGRMVTSSRFEDLAARVDTVEKALDQQRGRMTVYAALSGVILILIAIATLIVNHVRL